MSRHRVEWIGQRLAEEYIDAFEEIIGVVICQRGGHDEDGWLWLGGFIPRVYHGDAACCEGHAESGVLDFVVFDGEIDRLGEAFDVEFTH